jgi:hypothetical protein
MLPASSRIGGLTINRHLKRSLTDKPLPEPEPLNAKARPMSGFFAGLSAEQKKEALEYRGEESHGDKSFLHA